MAESGSEKGSPGSRHGAALESLRRSVLAGSGVLPPETRRRIYEGAPVSEDLERFVQRIRSGSQELTRSDIEAVKDAGRSEDEVFEAAVAAALGAADRLLAAGLRIIGRA